MNALDLFKNDPYSSQELAKVYKTVAIILLQKLGAKVDVTMDLLDTLDTEKYDLVMEWNLVNRVLGLELKWHDIPSGKMDVHAGTRTFTCAICNGEFEKGWSEEEAEAELSKNFPGFNKEECDQVCDDCYKKFMR